MLLQRHLPRLVHPLSEDPLRGKSSTPVSILPGVISDSIPVYVCLPALSHRPRKAEQLSPRRSHLRLLRLRFYLSRITDRPLGQPQRQRRVSCDSWPDSNAALRAGRRPQHFPTSYWVLKPAALERSIELVLTVRSWQHAVNNNPGGPLDDSYMQQYDTIVKSCLSLGAKCIVDLHNYARWNGGIVGQGGQCSNDDLASFWDQIVKRYQTEANFRNIVFGVMNEPHDLDMNAWYAVALGGTSLKALISRRATTVQTVVTRIRSSGATSQMILLPGTGYTSAAGFNTNSAPALSKVTNPDGSTSGLVYDVHKYFDSDSSGTSSSCKDDPQIDSAFGPLATYLKSAGRKALLTETGGGDGTDCTGQDGPVSKAFDFMAQNSDVFLGWVGWAAGSFKIDYTISETPSGSEDQPFLKDIIVGKFKGQGGYQRRH